MILPGTAKTQNRETDNVSFTVKLDGKNVTMDPGGLVSLSISLEWNRIPVARLVFADGKVEKQVFEKSNRDEFAPGKKVEIMLGYNQKEETIFKGIITRHSVKIQQGSHYKLEIECRDAAVKMTLVQRSHYHDTVTDTSIIRDIIKKYPDLQAGTLEETQLKHKKMVQYQATDWDFMLLRADANGLYLMARDGSIDLKKPALKPTPDLQVQFGMGGSGISLLEFESDIDMRNHYPEVNGSSWDESSQKLLDNNARSTATSSKKDFPDLYKDNPVLLYHGGDLESEELNSWVQAKQTHGNFSHTRGRVTVIGIKVMPGDTLELGGISDRFNGTHLVTGVLHQFYKGQWKTDVQFGWDKKFISECMDTPQADASGLVPGIRGLHIGIVTQIKPGSNDPQNRIQVKIPYIAKKQSSNDAEAHGIWARLGNVYAGDKRGFIFRPEINDEVIVGFVNNDPNDAIILGALYNSNQTQPQQITVDDKNPVKGMLLSSGIQMIFDDDKNKIHFSTGGDNTPAIEMDGKNNKISISVGSSTSIELTSSGIKINGTRIDLN